MKAFAMVGAALLLGGCGSGGSGAAADDAKKDEAPPARLAAGEYEVTSELVTLASTDNSTPATKMKQGDKFSVKACVAKDGTPDPALFAEPGDQCESTSSYISNGRMSVQLKCTRAGVSGQTMSSGLKPGRAEISSSSFSSCSSAGACHG